jgi:hypothetical protein
MWALLWGACREEPIPHIVREDPCPLRAALVSTADLYGDSRPIEDGILVLDFGPSGGLYFRPTLAVTCLQKDAVSVTLQLWVEDEPLLIGEPVFYGPEVEDGIAWVELSLPSPRLEELEPICGIDGLPVRMEGEISEFASGEEPEESDPSSLFQLMSTVELGPSLRESCSS